MQKSLSYFTKLLYIDDDLRLTLTTDVSSTIGAIINQVKDEQVKLNFVPFPENYSWYTFQENTLGTYWKDGTYSLYWPQISHVHYTPQYSKAYN